MSNIFKKIGLLWQAKGLLKLFKGGGLKMLKTWTGIIKVLTYALALASLAFGYLPAETVLQITIIISGVAKIAEIIVGLTPSKKDDERVAEVIKILKEKGLIKI